MEPDRIFFLDPYTDPTFKSISSPEIGYGISCAHAIKYGMKAANLSVIECSPAVNGELLISRLSKNPTPEGPALA